MDPHSLYSSLALKDGDIRLLTIFPDEWTADIRCEINVVSLNDKPQYAALSYVWGGPPQDGTLQINGLRHSIGRSLETALRYYRRAGWSMPLWADAICINQEDIAERSSQVSIMDRIYTDAATVFVVLGAGIDSAAEDYFERVKALDKYRFRVYGQEYFKTMLPNIWDKRSSQTAGKNENEDKESSVLFSFLGRAVNLQIDDHLGTVPQWGATSNEQDTHYPWQTLIQSFEDFTTEPWWARVWTLQESVVGHAPIFIYRTAMAPWAMIYEAADSMGAHIADCCTSYLANEAPPRYAASIRRLLAHVDSIDKTRQTHAKLCHAEEADQLLLSSMLPKTDFEGSYLYLHNRRKATDARDKVFALLSLIKPRNTPSFIYPDYGKQVEDVYITTARMIIGESGSLDLLAAAGRFRNDSLPSWVPDWSTVGEFDETAATQIDSLLVYDTASGAKASVKVHEKNNRLLELEGVILDHTKAIGEPVVSSRSSDETMWQAFFEWMQLAHTHSPSTTWVDFCKTLCTDMAIWPNDQVFRRMGPLTKEMIRSDVPWQDPVSGRFTRDMPPEQLTQPSVEEMKVCFSVWYRLLWRLAKRGMRSIVPPPTMEDFLKITTASKRFMVSSLGYIGLVPRDSEPGGRLIFFKGCRFPCVVRSVAVPNDETLWFELVRDCYVHDFMDGQLGKRTDRKTSGDDMNWEQIILC
ncbi:HET-domain-containing protein [Trichoderma citrinoviride]|uniref:HET-domain-containing protein n=1 Tax=Trichoderma citrinoviride TaxID=58853 RepID=A0A2T4BDB1_9HYPO|nr:HET-domain-containing protein [Trichoderma citrinoviride]PTB67231.1 HET-domain-containing protein [Trichoderma citrinoviride]